MIRRCKKCNKDKDLLLFTKKKKKNGSIYFLFNCIECNKKYMANYCKSYYQERKFDLTKTSQKWYIFNTDKKKIYDEQYGKKNKLKKKKYDLNYRIINKDKINNRIYNYRKNKRMTDPSYKLRKSISYSVWYYLNLNGSSKGNQSCLKFFSFSMQELKAHLESQFESWMTWDNYGSYHVSLWNDNDSTTWRWNIDHVIPQSKLPYTSMAEENFQKCWALENLRPLSARRNVIDGNRR